MNKSILINSTANEHRIAILEDKKLAELFVESPGKERIVGDIYLGKVARVMPGIRAAFIDIGFPQDAFLHFSDVGNSLGGNNPLFDDEEPEEEDDFDEEEGEQSGSGKRVRGNGKKDADTLSDKMITEKLEPGKEILVQITKEPTGKKGVRVTTQISLAGRFIVFLPLDYKVGVSKKIPQFKERRRLRRSVRSLIPRGYGAIIRTVAEGKTEEQLKQDLDDLMKKWQEIEKGAKSEHAPALIFKDLDTTSSVIRDLFSDDVQKVVVDDKRLYRDIKGYLRWVSPEMLDRLELYKDREPIFDQFGVEKDIQSVMQRKVWLKSGGYIILEKTEAMTVIDVNSGRYAANKEQEMNSLRTNLEAAREVVRQVRLRDIGGLIIIDFIDLEDEKNRRKVYEEVRKEFRRDRAKITVLPLTEFGLMQITRQRIRQNVQQSFSEPCPVCSGTGFVQSRSSVINQIERWIKRFRSETHEYRIELKVSPGIVEYLSSGTISRLTKIQLKFFVRIKLTVVPTLAHDEFRVYSFKQKRDITDHYLA